MASSRQRSRTPRKSTAPASTGTQASESNERIDNSQVLRAAFDTTPFEEGEQSSTESTDAPQVRFVGEQLVYKDRDARIAEAAYLRAEQRGFQPGYELDDWLAAEQEVDAQLGQRSSND